MWMLMVLACALVLALLPGLRERTVRLAIVPVIMLMISYQALKYGLL